jgi:hypothetical protein
MTTYQPIERDAPFASPATKRRIHGEFTPAIIKNILPKAEHEQLRALHDKMQAASKSEDGLSYDAARAAYRKLGGELVSHATAGDSASLEAAPGWTFQDVLDEFTEKRRAVRLHKTELTAAAWELAKPIRDRWAAAAFDLACEVETTERALAERFALAYAPGQVPLAIRKAAAEMLDPNFAPAGVSSIPEMLPFLTF